MTTVVAVTQVVNANPDTSSVDGWPASIFSFSEILKIFIKIFCGAEILVMV